MSDRENKMRAKTVVSRAEVQKESPATEKKSMTQKKTFKRLEINCLQDTTT